MQSMNKPINPLTGKPDEEDNVGMSSNVVAPPQPSAPVTPPVSVEAPAASTVVAQPQLMQTTDTVSTRGVSQQIATPQERVLQKEEDKLVQQQLKLADEAAALGRQKAIEDEAQANEKAKLTLEKETKVQSIVQSGEQDLKARLAEADKQYNTLKERSEIKDYWADKSTGDKVLAGLAIALGGLAGGMAGQPGSNKALEIIQKNVEQDFARQQANFMQQKSVLDEARKGGEAGRQAIADQLNLLNLSKAAAYESLADKYSAMAAKRGVPTAQLAADNVRLGLLQKSQDAKQEFERSLRQNVTSNVQTQVKQELVKAPLVSEDVKKAQDEFQGNEEFKAWKAKRAALDSYKALRAGGADGAAVADFIATGLKQGSFGPEMVNILEKRNLLDKAGNVVRENIIGGYSPKLLESLGNGLMASEAKARTRAKPVIERAKQVAKGAGLPPDYFTGADGEQQQQQPQQTPQLSEQDKQALDWANANPADPRAAAIKKRLGQ